MLMQIGKKDERWSRPRGGGMNVILKTTNVCNIACVYCSVGPAGRAVMSWESFERLADEVERVIEEWDLHSFTLTFHGGEPSTIGADWIARACERMKRLPVEVRFNMQTNLYKITDDFIAVAKKHDIKLGSSIDPICGERIGVDGRDTWPRWKENYARMVDEGFHIGGIFVVTKAAQDRARDVYLACEELNQYGTEPFGIQLNAVYPQGRAEDAAGDASDMNISPEGYGKFLVDMYDLWEERCRSIRINPVQNLASVFARRGRGDTGLACTFRSSCAGTHVGVDYDLNVAGCGRRLDSEAIFGNLHTTPLDVIIESSDEQAKLSRRYQALQETGCHDCRFFGICHGGCPDEAYTTRGEVMEKTAWCKSYLMLFHAIEERQGSVGHIFAEPRDQRNPMPEVTIRLGHTPEDLSGESPSEHVERWLLPSAGGGVPLGGEVDLRRILREPTDLLRVWVPNRQVFELNMWQDLLRDPRVVVALYEPKDLLPSLNLLNALDARVALDVPSLLDAEGGEAALQEVVERFCFDPMWKMQVGPLAFLFFHAVRDEEASMTTRWGLRPGSFGIVSPDQGYDPPPAIRSMVDALHRAQPDAPQYWGQSHAACAGCDRRAMCGGQFAPGNGQPCTPAAKAMVDRVHEVARQLVRELGATPAAPEAAPPAE